MAANFESGAPEVFQALLSGRPALKEEAIRAIDSRDPSIDRAVLRGRLLAAIRGDYRRPKRGVHEASRHADTRCWLLSALGRVEDDNGDARAEVRWHLDAANEPYEWARFWAFEGLVNGNARDLLTLAAAIAKREDEPPLVANLARVVLAASGDDDALDEVRETLLGDSAAEKWAVLRGLRVVPGIIPSLMTELSSIVEAGEYADVTYDAIVAIGKIPADSQYAEKAAMSLQKYLVEHRWPMYDSLRTRALVGLGNLRIERTAPVLIEELLDDSPTIVHNAALALEKVMGVRTATSRLMEAAARVGPAAVTKFGTALRSMKRTDVVEALESVMLTAPDEHREFARQLLSEVGGQYAFQKLMARTSAAEKYVAALEHAEEKIRELFDTSIKEAQHGFRVAIRMDVAVFILGLGLIAVSAALLLGQGKDLSSLVGAAATGGGGVLSVLYTLLVAKPREQVQRSVDHLMHLKIVFLGYLRQLHQVDQAYTRRLLDDETIAPDDLQRFSDLVTNTTSHAVTQLSENGVAPDAPPPAAQPAPRPQDPVG